LLYCVAGYPAQITDSDIEYLRDYPAEGFSDHSNDIKTPLAMIGAGARVIEKHFKLDNNCVDAAFSLDPVQMKLLCDIAHR
jgi:sialic acid synthase SpsE